MTQSIFTPPTQELLEAQARHFLWTCRRKAYLEAKKSGELEEWITLKAKAARRYAENLIYSGEPPEIAWNRAVRLEILESETD